MSHIKTFCKTLFCILLVTFSYCNVQATPQSVRNTKISLLTCGAGYEVYSMYGHTALRVKDDSLKFDIVINYGIFSLGIDNFAWLFVKGETDYEVAATSFSNFMEEYKEDNREVYENELQISDSAKRQMLTFLEWNLQPQNKVYRYKFFSDNCATRIRDLIERTTNIVWNIECKNRVKSPANAQFTSVIDDYWKKNTTYTFRDIILIYQNKMPWINAGIQLPIAAPADTHLTYRAAMFLPDFLMDAVLNAHVLRNGKLVSLAKPTVQLLRANTFLNPPQMQWYLLPQTIISAFFIVILILTIGGMYKKRLYRFIDVFLLFMTGLIGVMLIFMSFISVHECMRPNFNLWWALPLNFIAAFVVIFSRKAFLVYSRFLLIVYVTFFLVLPFIPQSIAFIQCALPLLLLIRILAYIHLHKTISNIQR